MGSIKKFQNLSTRDLKLLTDTTLQVPTVRKSVWIARACAVV
jgi:hypothetical protein